MNKMVCLISCFLSFSLLAENSKEFKAKELYDAEAFIEAIECYHELLETEKNTLRQTLLKYNIATSYLAHLDFEKAVQKFNELDERLEKLKEPLLSSCYLNSILSKLSLSKKVLMDLKSSEELVQVQALLEQSKKLLDNFEKSESFSEDYYEELSQLKLSYKTLKASYKQKENEQFFSKLNVEKALEELFKQNKTHLSALKPFLSENKISSLARYRLNQQYKEAQKKASFWNKLSQLLKEEKYQIDQELAKDPENEELKQKKELYEAKIYFFYEASSKELKALESYKEHRLEWALEHLAHQKWLLNFMNLASDQKDPLAYSLEEKVTEKSTESPKSSLWTQKALSGLNEWAISFLEQKMKVLKENEAFKEKVLLTLSKRLKEESSPSLDKLKEDLHLYQLAEKGLEKSFEETYKDLKQSLENNPDFFKEHQSELSALEKGFEAQKDLSLSQEDQKQSEALFDLYQQALSHLKKNETEEAFKALEKIQMNLNYTSYAEEKLQELIEQYQEYLQDSKKSSQDLSKIKEKEEALKESHQNLMKPCQEQAKVDQALQETQKKQELLEESSLNEKAQDQMLKNAQKALERTLSELQKKDMNSKEQLEKALNEQENSLETNQVMQEEISKQTESSKLFEEIQSAQDHPLNAAKGFENNLAQEKFEESKKQEIQKWFDKGKESAQKAASLLEQGEQNASEAQKEQQNASECWQKALSLFPGGDQEQEDSSSQGGQGEQEASSSSEKENTEQENSSPMQAQNASMPQDQLEQKLSEEENQESEKEFQAQELLQQLQEMQQEDDLSPKSPQPTQQGLRPW